MKKTYTKTMAYMGAGCGVVLFALFGLLQGSFLGGVVGVSIAGSLFGTPVEPGTLARLIISASMALGVLLTGTLAVTASSTAGWLIGTMADAITTEKKELAAAGNR